MSDLIINRLILNFPHGITPKLANDISRIAEIIGDSHISDGGCTILADHGDHLEFSDDSMTFNYSYLKKAKKG